MQENRSTMGIEGRFRVVRHDVSGMVGSGPDGTVEFEDLWTHDQNGKLVQKYPERTIEDREIRNKFLRRAQSYFMYEMLRIGITAEADKTPPEITYGKSVNPFRAFCLIGDSDATPTLPGDAKVAWNESDGQYDAKIPHGSDTAVYGRRGIDIANTTSGIFKKVQIRYPNASPNYEEQEYTFFAQANGTAQQTGDIGLDDFVVKSLCLATSQTSSPYAIGPGYDEAYSQLGIRAVLGLAPTHQGYCDRSYVHENYAYGDGSAGGLGSVTALHKFTGTETIDTRHGYVADASEVADTTLLTYASVNITFTAATKVISVTGAAFTTSHHRKTLTISGTVSNNGDFTIKRRISATDVEVFETVANEGPVSSTAVVKTRNTGDKAFDGRVENEGLVCNSASGKDSFDGDAVGTLIQGEKYVTNPTGTHIIGRIWPKASPKVVTGIRIVFPKGSIRDYCPDKFVIQYLNATHGGSGDPQPADPTDWTTVAGQDYSVTSQVANIFDNGEYGYEYHFAAPTPSTCGIRVSGISPLNPTAQCEIAEVYIYTAPSAVVIDSTKDQLKLSQNSGVDWTTYTCPAVASTTSTQTICDALNRVLNGWGLEAYRSTFGYLWVRSTCAGQYSTLDLALAASNPINSTIGLPNTRVSKGVTQPFTKLNTNAVTFIYTVRMGGNFAKPV